ncbi:MAG: extracellular solute-binding protein, partial [Anaerolineales bacterium]|nr:extracellular solute-binding protein [Anaerolineales bacterium]
DLILLPSDQLASAAEQQLIFPLNDLLPPDALTDLYPAALGLGTVDGRLMGYPYAINSLAHLAYHSNIITGTLPSVWTGLVETNTTFAYPVSGPAGGALALQFYLAEGGSLVNDAGQTSLQLDQLTEAFSELDQGHNNGLFPTLSYGYTSLAEAWSLFVNGQAEITLTVAEDFLAHRNDVTDAAFAPIPGPNGSLDPLIKGWVWAITTADPIRQAQAIDLIMELTSTDNLSSWSQQSNYLPASRSALARWNQDAYIIFLANQLEQAAAFPARADSAVISALSTATFDLFSGTVTTPEAAANNAFSKVRP